MFHRGPTYAGLAKFCFSDWTSLADSGKWFHLTMRRVTPRCRRASSTRPARAVPCSSERGTRTRRRRGADPRTGVPSSAATRGSDGPAPRPNGSEAPPGRTSRRGLPRRHCRRCCRRSGSRHPGSPSRCDPDRRSRADATADLWRRAARRSRAGPRATRSRRSAPRPRTPRGALRRSGCASRPRGRRSRRRGWRARRAGERAR